VRVIKVAPATSPSAFDHWRFKATSAVVIVDALNAPPPVAERTRCGSPQITRANVYYYPAARSHWHNASKLAPSPGQLLSQRKPPALADHLSSCIVICVGVAARGRSVGAPGQLGANSTPVSAILVLSI